MLNKNLESVLQRFARADMSAADFETWLSIHPELQQLLGKFEYSHLLSYNYETQDDLPAFRAGLLRWLALHTRVLCNCDLIRSHQLVLEEPDTPDGFLKRFRLLLENLDKPETWYVECPACAKRWLLSRGAGKGEWHFVKLSKLQEQMVLQHQRWPSEVFEKLTAHRQYGTWETRKT